MAVAALLIGWALGAGTPARQDPAVAVVADPPAAGTTLLEVDPASRVEFTLHTRWGQTLHGRFPAVAGRIEAAPGGQRRVRIELDAPAVLIDDHPRYTRAARGPAFFDVAAHPRVEFVSDAYPERLLHEGGELGGELFLHGVRQRERFVLAPSRCDRPGLDCDIVAFGTVQRSRYGIDGWKIALREPVRFALRVRTLGVAP